MAKHLTADDVLAIHYALVDIFREAGDPIDPPGPRPGGLLESAIGRPQTSHGSIEKYQTVEAKAAALLHSLVGNHPFHNGNKRTALVAALVFLDRNKRRFSASDDDLFEFVLAIANRQGMFSGSADSAVEEISAWLRGHVEPTKLKSSDMTLQEFLDACTEAGCLCRKSKKGEGWIVRGPKGESISIAGSTRQLKGNAIRKYVRLLGISEARSGIRLDEFQAGASAAQELIRRFRRVLDRLADA